MRSRKPMALRGHAGRDKIQSANISIKIYFTFQSLK